LIGLVGGLLTAGSVHLLGTGDQEFLASIGVFALFDFHPALGYAAFAVAGTVLAGIFWWIEKTLGMYE